jgi:hypothetical protein
MADEATDIRSAATPKIVWDDSRMKSSYANVCNVASTREEVVLFFGISNPTQNAEAEVQVKLSDRLILSPFAANRLSIMLGRVLEQHEARFGSLGPAEQTPASATKN